MRLTEIAVNTVHGHPLLILNTQTWCVKEQYWFYLGRYDTGEYRKVVIRLDDNLDLKNDDNKLGTSAINVLVFDKYMDIKHLLELSKDDKKRAILELIHNTMLVLAKQFNWAQEPLLSAYEKCIQSGIDFKWKWKEKNFRSPTRQFAAYVECGWETDYFKATAYVVSLKDENMVKQEVLIETEPYFGDFIYYCKAKWDSPTVFSLYSNDNRKWSIGTLSIV